MRTLLIGASLALAARALAQTGGGFDLTWNTIDGGGGLATGGSFILTGTIGQPDAGIMTGGSLRSIAGGFWARSYGETCYVNCDNSTVAPILNVNDFTCFINRFAVNDPYANCDHSTTAPVLNVNDFTCFINRFALGCP